MIWVWRVHFKCNISSLIWEFWRLSCVVITWYFDTFDCNIGVVFEIFGGKAELVVGELCTQLNRTVLPFYDFQWIIANYLSYSGFLTDLEAECGCNTIQSRDVRSSHHSIHGDSRRIHVFTYYLQRLIYTLSDAVDSHSFHCNYAVSFALFNSIVYCGVLLTVLELVIFTLLKSLIKGSLSSLLYLLWFSIRFESVKSFSWSICT